MFSSNTSQVSNDAVYVEDVFSTYLYTGNGSTQTITNGIDTSTYGGMVWIKSRSDATSHFLTDTVRGTSYNNASNSTSNQNLNTNGVTSFGSNGFSIGNLARLNTSASTYASWTFRKQPKFFDVLTYTGDGNSTSRNIAHNLGSVAGTIIVKRTDSASNWAVAAYDGTNWKVGTTTTPFALNLTNASTFNVGSVATSTTFNVCRMQWSSGGNPTDDFNVSGGTYVAYLFAHDAGGFGLTGTDNVISCGSYTGNGGTTTPNQINIGFEPQWLLIKASSTTSNWAMGDLMRGMYTESGGTAKYRELLANTSGAEGGSDGPAPTATGFAVSGTGLPNASGVTYIYIAIRRGPMKTPTSGTSVYQGITRSGTGATATVSNVGFPSDLVLIKARNSGGLEPSAMDRLRGAQQTLFTPLTNGESTLSSVTGFDSNVGYTLGTLQGTNGTGFNFINWNFRRAPGFFDVVCWAGNDVAPRNIDHNLTVVPEMMIVKRRSGVGNWVVYHKNLPSALYYLSLNATNAQSTGTNAWRSTAPTATVFTVGNDSWVNTSSDTYVNYLFASCPGVSKVGSYTGTGTTLQIDCGFTGGARFVLIKRTDSTGDWYVWDSARGIVAGNDPYLLLNSTAAEVTNTDYVDTYSAGFEISSTAPAAINANGGSFVFLAIA